MTLDEFRRQMNEFWTSANREAEESRDSHRALERLAELYARFDREERELADQVLCEWLLSDDEAKRFDAVALIRQFQITSAIPSLRRLRDELGQRSDPGAPFEREKVDGLLAELYADGAPAP